MLFFIIFFIIIFILYKLDHLFFDLENKDEVSSNKNNIESSSEDLTLIEVLYPIIDILCHYSTIIDKEWTSEKIRNIKLIFEKDCSTENQLTLLRDRIKLSMNINTKPFFTSSISKYLMLNPDMESKISLFQLLIHVLSQQSHDHHLIIKISLDFSEKIDIPYHYAIEILKEHGYFIDDEYTHNSQSTNDNESKDIKDLQWAFKVFDLDMNTTSLNEEIIKKTFQRKIRAFHPDKNGSVTEPVQEILKQKSSDVYEAREILLNYISKI